jgi:hypothetical protein
MKDMNGTGLEDEAIERLSKICGVEMVEISSDLLDFMNAFFCIIKAGDGDKNGDKV